MINDTTEIIEFIYNSHTSAAFRKFLKFPNCRKLKINRQIHGFMDHIREIRWENVKIKYKFCPQVESLGMRDLCEIINYFETQWDARVSELLFWWGRRDITRESEYKMEKIYLSFDFVSMSHARKMKSNFSFISFGFSPQIILSSLDAQHGTTAHTAQAWAGLKIISERDHHRTFPMTF